MKKDLKRRLYRAERSKIIPVWQGIKTAFNKALPMQPRTFAAVSVENGVWEIMVDGRRIGGVIADVSTIHVAMRMLARRIECHLYYEDCWFGYSDSKLRSFYIQLFES